MVEGDKRRQDRVKAVLPVRVRGRDIAGEDFEELVHTLDVAPAGVRLGAIHHRLKALDSLTVLYRQRRIEFRVVWTRKLDGLNEYQVGLQALTQDQDAWGLNLSDFRIRDTFTAPSPISPAAAG